MNKKAPHVLIIGGGIGGPALGLFLQKAGIQSTIFEAYPFKEGVGGGFNIAPNGVEILKALGLAENTIKKGTISPLAFFRNGEGKQLATMKYESSIKDSQPAVSMSRATLYEIFAQELKDKNVPIHYEKRIKDITQGENSITAHFADGTTAEGDLLVGADGINSFVRQYMLPDGPKPAPTGILGIGGFVSLDKLKHVKKEEIEALTYTFGLKGFFGHGGGDAGTILWWTNLTREQEWTREELLNPDWKEIKKEVLETFKDYYQPIPDIIEQTDLIMRHNIRDIQSLPTWHKGRIILMGDAAHAVSPNAGQGASMALEDAMYLAKMLRDNETYEQAFKAFEKGRKDRCEKIVAEGRRRGGDKNIVSPFKAKIREIFMSIFFKLFGTRGMRWIMDYRINWEKDQK